MSPPAASATFKTSLGPEGGGRSRLVWLHGWGHDHRHLIPLAGLFEGEFRSTLYDLPGFGQTPPLEAGAGTGRYAEWLAAELAGEAGKVVLIGHSFGCRVALRLAARWPDKVAGLVLIAAPGLPRRRSLGWRLKALGLKGLAAAAGLCDRAFKTRRKEAFRNRFGSRDYRAAGPLRASLVAAVTEDLSETASNIRQPVLLIYGERDAETPPDIGRRFQALIPHSEFAVLPGIDHYNVLNRGVFRCERLIRVFLGAKASHD